MLSNKTGEAWWNSRPWPQNSYCLTAIREASTDVILSSLNIDLYLTEAGTVGVTSQIEGWWGRVPMNMLDALSWFPQCGCINLFCANFFKKFCLKAMTHTHQKVAFLTHLYHAEWFMSIICTGAIAEGGALVLIISARGSVWNSVIFKTVP